MTGSLKTLIDDGAVNIVVPGALPLGCLPSYLTVFHSDDSRKYDEDKCIANFNTFARFHNDVLKQALYELRREYPRVHLVYADYYNAFVTLRQNHAILGFKKSNLRKACCGYGGGRYNFNFTNMCNDHEGDSVCAGPSKYLHWDRIRLTTFSKYELNIFAKISLFFQTKILICLQNINLIKLLV